MKRVKVREIMVPVAQYATVSADATLYEAILALEQAHQQQESSGDHYRAILVYDEGRQIVGKLDLWSVLEGIEPRYRELSYPRESLPFGADDSIVRMLDTYGLWKQPIEDICRKAGEMSVRDFMQVPSRAEYIDEDAALDEAIHQLIMGHFLSLLVTRAGTITGVLRLSDVFQVIRSKIRSCRS